MIQKEWVLASYPLGASQIWASGATNKGRINSIRFGKSLDSVHRKDIKGTESRLLPWRIKWSNPLVLIFLIINVTNTSSSPETLICIATPPLHSSDINIYFILKTYTYKNFIHRDMYNFIFYLEFKHLDKIRSCQQHLVVS